MGNTKSDLNFDFVFVLSTGLIISGFKQRNW